MSIKTLNFFKRKRNYLWLSFFFGASFLFAQPALASDWAGEVIGGIIGVLISALGVILILVIKGLILIASYQDFIGSQAVVEGWVIVRDIANMFFVVILLIIAFSTILHIENYSYKKWLPKLILMAVLINFSKTICGLMIDVAQIVMLTFVNAFKDVAGGNIIDMLGITDIVTMEKEAEGSGFWTIVGAYVLGLIYIIIALVVITTMMMILAMRLVMIWIYVVLSPLAYLLSAFPGGAQYASKWWKDFTQNLIVGPVLAFFIWLSFAALQTGTDLKIVTTAEETNISAEMGAVGGAKGESNDALLASKASTPGALIKFVIGIGMLIGGLKIAKEIGGAAGSIADKGMGNLSKLGAMGAGAVGGFALGRAKWAGRNTLGAASLIVKGAGYIPGVNKTGLGKSLKKMGDIGLSYRRDLLDSNKKAKIDKRKKFLEKIGVGAETADKISQGFGKKNIEGQSAVTGINAALIGGALMGPFGALAAGATALAAGSLAGWGLNKLSKNRAEVIKDAEDKVAIKQGEYDAKVGGPDEATALLELEKAKNHEKQVKGKFVGGPGIEGAIGGRLTQAWNWIQNLPGNINKQSTEFTTAAAKKIADVEVKARQVVETAAKDPTFMDDVSPAGLYSSNGQQDHQEAFVRHLADDTPDGADARTNIGNWIDTKFDHTNEAHKNKLRALAKNIAATDKKGDVDIDSLRPLMNKINSKESFIGGTIEGFKSGVISYRNTGIAGEAGTGGIYVDSFAKGKNAGGAEVLAADFEKLKASGINIKTKAEGVHIEPEDMKAVADALLSQIQEAKINLEGKRESMSAADYQAQKNTLDSAEKKLQNPDALKGLSIVNTKSANFGREARLTSAYHEQIHGAGIKDEELAEGLAQALMSKQLYGRNPETGVRHSQEVAAIAKAMSEGGASNAEVLKEMTAEIAERSSRESKSRAERVLKMESGKHETEKEFVAGNQAEGPEAVVDTKGILTQLRELAKAFKGFKSVDNGILMTKLFTYLGKVVTKGGEKTTKAITKLRPDKATTPLEIEVIAGEVSKTQV